MAANGEGVRGVTGGLDLTLSCKAAKLDVELAVTNGG